MKTQNPILEIQNRRKLHNETSHNYSRPFYTWGITLFMLLVTPFIWAQSKTITGTVKDDQGAVLPGVNILVKGTTQGTQTDFDGNYSITAEVGQTLVFTFVGFQDHEEEVGEQNVLNIVLQTGSSLDEVVLLGSRSRARTATDSPVPVDIFSVEETSLVMPQTNVNQILNAIAPSFTSTVQTAADGTDHLDPAQLRGMGPDQVLVLLNGKRRHTSALVNVNGSTGKGSVGTDLNAIPSFALRNIEVLRDGASAQYGSDAISGVMNLVLKDNIGLSGQINVGGNFTDAAKDHTKNWDGAAVQADLNYGAKLGQKGGFINTTFSIQHRQPTSRAGVRTGQIYNAYNAIEGRAAADGFDLNAQFDNINLLSGSEETSFINSIQQYAQGIDYFDGSLQNSIQSATSIAQLQDILGADVTEDELAYRGLERRDFNMIVGQSKLTNTQIFINTEIPLNDDLKIYGFGGYGYRDGQSGGFYRMPIQSNAYTSVYPDGYLPNIKTKIQDFSLSAGIKGKLGDWNVDLSNTFGQNKFDFEVTNSHNVSLRSASPTTIKAGGPQFLQNTINLDFNRDFDVFENLNFAFGVEQRHENYKIHAGQPESYLAYDSDGNPVTPTTTDIEKPTDFFGELLPGASQVFGGFHKDDAVDESRDSYAAYVDFAVDFTDWFLVDAAARYEHYSDFGNTVNFKVASRIKLSPNLNWRFAGSTGFRAPSIHQIYFNQSSTFFVDGDIIQQGTFRNDSEVAQLLGIPKLKEEKSYSLSTGFTYKIPSANLTFTVDGYFIKVEDRIILTGRFDRPSGSGLSSTEEEIQSIFDQSGVSAGSFFANAIDTETKGLDIVVSHKYRADNLTLTNDLGVNLNQTRKVGGIHSSKLLKEAGLEGNYFDEGARVLLEEAVPRFKASLSNMLQIEDFQLYLRNTYYGEVTDYNVIPDTDNEHQKLAGKVITDLSAAYSFTDNLSLTIGANNLFDLYPKKNLESLTSGDQFVYSRSASQFGLNGRYVFAKLGFKF